MPLGKYEDVLMKILSRNVSENARTYAVRVLLYNIIHLELLPGSAVSENELSEALSLSRTPIREALIELSRINLVEILPQRGSYITKIDYELVEESRFMRLALENAVLNIVCQNIPESYTEALSQNLQAQRNAQNQKNYDTFLDLDNEFHKLIFEAANKTWSYQIVKEQMVHFDRLRTLSTKFDIGRYTLQDHEDIFYAITRQDSELAQMLMTRHLTRHRTEKEKLLERYPDYFIV